MYIYLSIYLSIYLLPPFMKKTIPIINVRQTFLTLTNFIEKNNNIYNIKYTSYKIFYDKFNDTNFRIFF